MNPVALFLTLVSALLHASRDFLIKKSSDKLAFSWLFRVLGIAFVLPFAIARLGTGIPIRAWVFIGTSAAIHALYTLSLSKAYEKGDLSLVYPIARSSPIFVLLWSTLVWHEAMNPAGIAGVLTLVFGAYLLQVRAVSWRALLAPLRMAFFDRSLRFAWVTAILVAAYSLIDDRGVMLVDPILFLFLYAVLSCLLLAPTVFGNVRRRSMAREWRQRWPLLVAAAVASSGGYLLALVAFRMEHVGYVVAVRQASILFSVILGWRVLKEPHGWSRLAGATIMICGMLIIGFAA